MFKTDDNYNFYFDGLVSEDQEIKFKKLIDKHKLAPEFINLLKIDFNFRVSNTYDVHKTLIWVLYKILGPFAVTIFFAEDDHPPGCEYQAKVDFYVDASGNFDYELKNHLFIYEDFRLSAECEERKAQKSVGFEKDSRIRGNIREMELGTFIKSVTAD